MSIKRVSRAKSPEKFISEAKQVSPHFDYSKTKYVNVNTKVTLICKVHGDFEKWPSDVLRGSGCPKCSGLSVSHDEFIRDMESRYPQYDFSHATYKTAKTKVKVICPKHGEFSIRPNDLKNGVGCIKCGFDSALEKRIESGLCRHPSDIPALEQYRLDVWKISNQQFNEHYYTINPDNLKRGHNYHLDHKYPIALGFGNDVPPEVIGSHHNLQMLPARENRSKNTKCDILLEDLLSLTN